VYGEPAYYADIWVCLPDVRWGDIDGMPPCVNGCHIGDADAKVGVHGFQTGELKNCGRRVNGRRRHYFAMSRRYICHGCERLAKKKKDDALAAAAARGEAAAAAATAAARGEPDDTEQYTFMGYDARSTCRLPYGWGNEVPCFFTHKSAVDHEIIDDIRPMFDKGVRPEGYSDILLEQHTKEHMRQLEKREHEIERNRKSAAVTGYVVPELFSEFGDQKGYAGLVPTGEYIELVYKRYMRSIIDHLIAEVKKRGAKNLNWDASYKEPKHLGRYHGEPLFKALITATNELGEIRQQFHVVTDGHEQFVQQLRELVSTIDEYGQDPTELVSTDKPWEDKAFFLSHLPGVQRKQTELDAAAPPRPDGGMAVARVDAATYKVLTTPGGIGTHVDAMRDIVKARPPGQRVIALDTECDTTKGPNGHVIGKKKDALVQLSYMHADAKIITLVIRLTGGALSAGKLNPRLLDLLADPSITFVGSMVSADLKKLGNDFSCRRVTDRARYANLGMMAREAIP
jgi:hypothetical protein